jgi:hypothetical protein
MACLREFNPRHYSRAGQFGNYGCQKRAKWHGFNVTVPVGLAKQRGGGLLAGRCLHHVAEIANAPGVKS